MTIRDDFKEFFGKSRDEVFNEMGNISYTDARVAIYNDINPTNDTEARSMYRDPRYVQCLLRRIDNDYFKFFEDRALAGEFERNESWATRGCLENKPMTAKVLDYGAGHCDHALALWFRGYHDVTVADIPHEYFRFFEFICHKRGINIKFVPIENEMADLPDMYDFLISSEMLEHCWNPIQVLKYLVSKMKQYGLIYISDFFDDCHGEDPSHLKHNNIYQDIPLKFKTYEALGIEPYIYDINKVLKVWKKF